MNKKKHSNLSLLLTFGIFGLIGMGVIALSKLQLPTETSVNADASQAIYWGAFVKGETYGLSQNPPWDMRALDIFERNVGKQVSIFQWGTPWFANPDWPQGYYPFPTQQMEAIRLRGSIPMVDWRSWNYQAVPIDSQPQFTLRSIIDGKHDAFITSWATSAKNWGHPFFLRFNPEMNGDWYPWSEVKNGNSRGEFILAWRHVHDIFTRAGATNVTWVWSPNVELPITQPLAGLYPGDTYVDWVAMDGYNWGSVPNHDGWISFYNLFKPTYDQLQLIAPSKPVMIAETSSHTQGGPAGTSKEAWIIDALVTQIPNNFPNIKAVMWFNWDTDGAIWHVESSPESQLAFSSAIANPYYSTNTFINLPAGKINPLSIAAPSPTITTSPLPSPTIVASPVPSIAPSGDTTAPSVMIDSPTSGTTVAPNSLLTIGVTATDASGIDKVVFKVNRKIVSTDSVAPYAYTNYRTARKAGSQIVIDVIAYDKAGNTKQVTSTVTTK